jgi:tetratricopeptide (TPR) repeat protein
MPRWRPVSGAASTASGSRRDRQLRAAAEAEASFRAGDYERARAAFVTVIAEYQQELQARPDDLEVNAQIAGQLNNLGLCLSRLRRYGEAVDVLDGAATIFEALGEHDDPARWRPLLAGTLQSLAGALGEVGRWDRALGASRRAVELRRAGPRKGSADPDLARALRMFALVRARAGSELDEAEQALGDAMAVHMTVLGEQAADDYVDEVYATEMAQSLVLGQQGRHEEAARVADGARARHLDGLPAMIRAQRSR